MRLVRIIFRCAHSLRKKYWKTFKIKTYGARVMMLREGRVLLVRHRYNDLWVFPGGNMKLGENIETAAAREIYEETGYVINTFELTLGSYQNTKEGKSDTVTILVTCDFEHQDRFSIKNKISRLIEVRNLRWFDLGALPEEISGATRRRIEEYSRGDRDVTGVW